MPAVPTSLLACPRCDKTPLGEAAAGLHCPACKTDFPLIAGIPWLFAEPQATLGEWRGRLQFALQQLSQESATLTAELAQEDLRELTRGRLERYRGAVDQHRRALQKLLGPLDVQSNRGSFESYLALRTRLPTDQGLNTYYANVHRDWAWGGEENEASLQQVRDVLQTQDGLGRVLVLGAGAGRLAYDIHMQLDCSETVALDFNPLLVLVAAIVSQGEKLELHEFPIAPRSIEDDAVLRTLSAPSPVREGFHLVLGDALRPPFAAASFDTVVTPWLIDILPADLATTAARVNALLKERGRWVNFGSLAFAAPQRALRYSADETKAIVAETGFAEPSVVEATIPYMCSPASRHGRRETVFSFSARKEREAARPARHRALPDWIVKGDEPVPLSASFRSQAMSTQIYAFIMSLIDGKRSLEDMAVVLESQQLMSREEAIPAIRSFLTRMHDDAHKPAGF